MHAQGSCAEATTRALVETGRPATAESTAVRQPAAMDDARAYATWAATEREFSLGGAASNGRLLLPRHSRARFVELLEWMARDERRRALMPTVMRATGIYTRQTRLVDWGADAGVQARFDELMIRGC